MRGSAVRRFLAVTVLALGTGLGVMGAGVAPAAAQPPTPASVATSQQFGVPDQTDVFRVNGNGAVEVRWVRGAGGWEGPLTISPPGLAPPGAHLAASRQFGAPDQTDVFVVGDDGAIRVLWVRGAGRWQGPLAISPTGFAPPGAGLAASNQFGIPDQTDLFVVGGNGLPSVFWVRGLGRWQGPRDAAGSGVPQALHAPPGANLAASNQFGIPDQTDLFVVGNLGQTQVSWVQGAGVWRGPLVILDRGFVPPGAALRASNQFGIPDQTDVFLVGNDGAMLVVWVQGAGAWNGATNPLHISPPGLFPPEAGIAASNQFGLPDQTDVVAVDASGTAQVLWVQGAGRWARPVAISPPGIFPAGGGLASSRQFGIPDQTDVFLWNPAGTVSVLWVADAGPWAGPLPIPPA
ncbi:MAG TPA: hypothetical protein VE152_11165 [Acidimicrobiales bacterium]|nr:hypothetical protein [Acidimicrobiales bacterium]